MLEDRDELLARIATLYYYHDQSQQQIAQALSLSRSNVSRMLKEARERGIVEISIHYPIARDFLLEQQIKERFGLRAAVVVQATPGSDMVTLQKTAQLSARMLDEQLDGAKTLAISWGTTVHAIVDLFTPSRRYDVEVVQLMGGVSSDEPAIDGPSLVARLARHFSGRYRYLHAPLVVDQPELATALLGQRNIAEALEAALSAEVALVGIGALEPSVSSLLRAGYLSHEEFAAIVASGAVGDVCARHFDDNGNPAFPEIDARVIAITLAQLAAIPTVIGAACNSAKARAIRGVLRGGYLDILVTDSEAAEAVLELDSRLVRTAVLSNL
ncbi:MAG: sugar-binding transcriptional regulator [Chloroflexales bacterium]|nr:sugar-binding transcriptional regulator [Chloroflexales bacterium]